MDKLVILTLNVHGLRNYKKRKDIISHFWFPLTGTSPHILFLQETHSTSECEKFWTQDFQSRNVIFSHNTASSGGLLVVIRQGVPFTLRQSIVLPSYIIVNCIIAGEEFVLVNVYNTLFGKCNYRQMLLEWFNNLWTDVQKFPAHRILLGGDFNLQLDAVNNLNNVQKVGSEIFSEFLQETDLGDCWSILHPTDRRFTFYHTLKQVLRGSRLDYVLVSPLLLNYLYSCSIGTCYQSDHCSVEAVFWMNRNPRGLGVFRFPDYLLSDSVYCEVITSLIDDIVKECIEDSPSALWDRTKLAIQNRTREYLSCSKAHLKEYAQLSSEIQDLQGVLDEWIDLDGPTDDLAREITQKSVELEKLKENINKPQKASNIARSQVFEDTCSKYFFKKVKGIAGALRQLFDNTDNLVSNDAEILQLCSAFYADLFAQDNPPSCKLSNYTTPPPQRTLTQEQCTALAAPITKDDVEYSLRHMKKGKSPGCDGLTVAFYLRFWPVIGDLVFDSISYAQEVGSFTTFQRLGVLKLLPKPSKDPWLVTNLRPITLLNLDYKLFTKTLADRMKEVLPTLLHTDQTGFVKGRLMGNNVLDIYALIAMADELDNDDIVFLSLDIHKAFDSIRWDFLRTVLWGFGFPEVFLDWVTLSQQNAQVQILNNGHLSGKISIKCGLLQGCGLSPFLFVLAIEGLANTIRADDRIPGIALHDICKKIAQVADDTLLLFIGSRSVIRRVKCVLDHFSHLSGLKLNYDKSSLIALGKKHSGLVY